MHAPYTFKIIALFFAICTGPYALSQQVGIGTTTPRTTLEVAGDTQISGIMDIGTIPSLQDNESSTFLIQDTDNSIQTMDVSNPTGAALGYIQTYVITNAEKDWVKDFDTGIDATDFVVITTSAYYNKEVRLTDSGNAPDNMTIPYTSTFVQNGTWHIIADFPVAANVDPADIGSWTISTLIFSSDLSKSYGNVMIPMLNGTTGSAVTPIID
jgi:hypothetical protein